MKAVTESWMALAARLHRQEPSARRALQELLHERMGRDATPGRIDGVAWALSDWFAHGLTLTVFRSIDDAAALAETEPPAWDTPYPTGGGQWAIEIDDCFVLYKGQWGVLPDDKVPREIAEDWSNVQRKTLLIDGTTPFDGEQLNRLTNNVLVALTERPEGISVTERKPSAKAARKRGRRYFPGVEYVIGSTTPLWRPEDDDASVEVETGDDAPGGQEREMPAEGWTLSWRTIVRGHWRQQPYGPRMTERRVTWIKPHWKGPKGAPISAHATRISR